jgi:hypothetical protein
MKTTDLLFLDRSVCESSDKGGFEYPKFFLEYFDYMKLVAIDFYLNLI